MSLLTRKIRGFRVLDMIALGLLLVLILSVYLAKTFAGTERTEIASVERQIAAEHDRIRLLQAEVSHLERPERIEQLSVSYLGLAPIDAKHEVTPEALSQALRGPQPVVASARPAADGTVPVVMLPADPQDAPPPAAPAAAAPSATKTVAAVRAQEPTL